MDDETALLLSKVVTRIAWEHPEYAEPGRKFTAFCIKDILRTWSEELDLLLKCDEGIDLEGWDNDIADEDVEAITDKLPERLPGTSLDLEAVHLIVSLYNDMLFDRVIEENADSECLTAWQYNNRANSRALSDRPLEALEDYNTALAMEPDSVMYMLGRAKVFNSLDMHMLAERDAILAYSIMQGRRKGSNEHFLNLEDAVSLADVLLSCGRMDMAVETLQSMTCWIRFYLPHLSGMDTYGFTTASIEGHSSSINVSLLFASMLKILSFMQDCLKSDDKVSKAAKVLSAEIHDLQDNLNLPI